MACAFAVLGPRGRNYTLRPLSSVGALGPWKAGASWAFGRNLRGISPLRASRGFSPNSPNAQQTASRFKLWGSGVRDLRGEAS